jgi:hypothetical protein
MKTNETLFRASIEVRNYSETNKTVLNPENADGVVLNIGLFERPSQAEKIRKLLSDHNKQFTFLMTLKEEINYDETTDL